MSADDYELRRNGEVVGRWGKGDKLDQYLTDAIAELKDGPRPPAAAPPSPTPRSVAMPDPKPPAGGLFFALVDELAASERRLDAIAAPLLDEVNQTEKLAALAVEGRRAKLAAAREYIDRIRGETAKLEEGAATNGGPTVADGAEPSSAASPSPPASSVAGETPAA